MYDYYIYILYYILAYTQHNGGVSLESSPYTFTCFFICLYFT
jgi:hypothetical protein